MKIEVISTVRVTIDDPNEAFAVSSAIYAGLASNPQNSVDGKRYDAAARDFAGTLERAFNETTYPDAK